MTAQDIFQIVTVTAIIQCICDIIAYYTMYETKSYYSLCDQLESSKSKINHAKSKLKVENKETTTTTTTKSKTNSNKKQNDKQEKVIQRLEYDHSNLLSAIAIKHFIPTMGTSILFFILLRILGTEYKGHVIGVLPFVPYKLIQRLTLRGLTIDPNWSSNDVATSTLLQDFIVSNLNGTNTNTTSIYSRTATSGVVMGITDIGQLCSFTFIFMLCNMSIKVYIHELFGKKPPKGAESPLTAIMDSPNVQQLVHQTTGIDPNSFKTE